MRGFLIGQKWLGAEVLSLLQRRGHDAAGVTAPDGDRLCRAGGALALPQGKLTAEVLPDKLDLIVCAHAHVFVKAAVRDRAKLGAIGYHPSLLPRHRGRDAVAWTVKMADPIAGGSIYWLDDGPDPGPTPPPRHRFRPPRGGAAGPGRRRLRPRGPARA